MTQVLRNALILGAACGALGLAGCQKPADAGTSVDVAREANALRQAELDWSKEMALKDPAKMAAHYADDALFTDPINASMHGKAAIQAAYAQVFKDKAFTLSFAPDQVVVAKSGEVAFTTGRFHATWTGDKGQGPMQGDGVYVTNYVKGADGKWLIKADFAHGDSATPLK